MSPVSSRRIMISNPDTNSGFRLDALTSSGYTSAGRRLANSPNPLRMRSRPCSGRSGPGAASVELAREFAATLVAAEREKIAQDTRTAVREALLRLAKHVLTASRIYDTLGVQVADEIIADILYRRDREYPLLPERNAP